jgi:hypothetical protein
VGGDYTKPEATEHNVAITSDGGATWTEPAEQHPAGFRSAVVYVSSAKAWIAVGTSGSDISFDDGRSWLPFDTAAYNAVAFSPEGSGWAAGPTGTLGFWRKY